MRRKPIFRGKAIYSKTLQTKDVYEARKMRDLIVAEFTAMVDESALQESRRAFMAHYAEAKKAREEHTQLTRHMTDEETFNARDALENAFNVYAAVEKGDTARADAYLAAIHDKEEVADTYALTLKDAAWEFIKAHQEEVAQATLSRVKIASASLLKVIGDKDAKLKDVTPRQVTRWINAISKTSSDNTRGGYIAALHKMWHWAWEHEHVDGDSPFKGIKIQRQGDEASYMPFKVEEVQRIAELAGTDLWELVRFGLGCVSKVVKI